MKKVILFVPYFSGYGGTETVIHNLLIEYFKNLNRVNTRIIVYSIGGFLNNTCLKFSNIKIYNFPKNRFWRELLYIFTLPFMISYFIIKIHPNAIISTTPVMWSLSKIFTFIFRRNIPVVGWYHYSFNAKPINKFFLHCTDYYLTISNSGKKELINKGVSSNKIFVVYNPVIPSTHIIRRTRNHNKFIYVGRIEYNNQKNLQDMFKALSMLRTSNWSLHIYGAGKHKEILKLKYLAKELHIRDNIIFEGFHRNVFDHIKNADALLLTSNFEGFPMVIAEAISHGLYVISANCPNGPSELINSSNGNLYKMHDLNQLSKLIRSVIEGHKCFNHRRIKNSIRRLYINKYYWNFIRSLNIIMQNK